LSKPRFVGIKVKPKSVLFISDLHIPFLDFHAYELAKRIIVDIKPEVCVLGGDLIDFYSVSSWTVNMSAGIDVGKELSSAIDILQELRDLMPKAEFYYIQGNHEERFQKYILKRADRLAPLLNWRLSVQELLGLGKFKIEYVTRPLKIGRLFFIHGHEKKARGQVVHIALNMLRYFKRNILFGHFHKFDVFYDTELEGSINGAYVNGCLCDLAQMPTPYEYIDTSQRGISIILFYGEHFRVEQMVFHRKIKNGAKYFCFGHGYCYEV
jgi:predicted phosphodiesterase